MHDFVRRSWLITALFFVPIVAIELMGWWGRGYPEGLLMPRVGILPAVALLVTPSIWWWLVARRRTRNVGWAAAAGAISAVGILLPPTLYLVLAFQKHGFGTGEWGILDLYGTGFTVGMWVLGVPLGAGLGMLAVMMQTRGLRRQRA